MFYCFISLEFSFSGLLKFAPSCLASLIGLFSFEEVGNFFRAELSEVSGDVCVCGHFEKRGLICEQLA